MATKVRQDESGLLSDFKAKDEIDEAINFIKSFFPRPRSFDVRLWTGVLVKGDEEPRFILILNHPGALCLMYRPPFERSLAEAYIRGDFDVEGDLLEVFDLCPFLWAR